MDSYKTKHKEYIFNYLKNHKDMRFSIQDMHAAIEEAGLKINITTIYRNVDNLVAEGKLLKFKESTNDYATYQYIDNQNCQYHLHLECKKCGKMIHLEDDIMAGVLSHINDDLGFRLECQNSILVGYCKECKNKFVFVK